MRIAGRANGGRKDPSVRISGNATWDSTAAGRKD